MINYGKQTIVQEDIDAVVEVLKSGWLTTGPKVEEFEQAFADYIGVKHAVSFSNGTGGLHGAMAALELNRGDEVITTPMTFAATTNSILYVGAKPVFVDVEPDTLLIDPNKVEKAITHKTKAILAVDYAGHPCDYTRLLEIAGYYGLFLIADSCHSLGARYKDLKIESWADMSVYSFHPVKAITTGEGGMVTCNDPVFAQKLKQFRNHGRKGYSMWVLGFNYRLTDIQCALGISQLKRLDSFLRVRRSVAAYYDEVFKDVDSVEPLAVRDNVEHAWHLYVVKVENRNKVKELMYADGVGTAVHYPPVHLHPYYMTNLKTKPGLCPIAEDAAKYILSLPIYPTLSDVDQDSVIISLVRAIDETAK